MSSFEMRVIPEKHQATAGNMISEVIELLGDNQTHLVLALITTFISTLAEATGESELRLMGIIFDAIQYSKSQEGATS